MNKDDILETVKRLESGGTELHRFYQSLETAYFMEEVGAYMKRPMSDQDDFKLTISPAARNSVVGLVRLLTTNIPRWQATSESSPHVTPKIEKLCERIWTESCEAKVSDVHTDLARSAALYGECHARGELVSDLLLTAKDDEKDLLTDLWDRTPALIEAMSPMEDWPYFGRHGLRGLLRKYMMTGAEIGTTWKDAEGHNLKDSTEYEVNDWTDTQDRMIWLGTNTSRPIFGPTAHKLKRMLIQVQFADGSTLWRKEDRRRQPFLYALIKSGIWRRQTLVLSEIFTAINERGTGILLGFEEEPQKVEVNFAGPGVRYITAKNPKMLSDTAYDPELVGLIRNVLDPLTDASTVFPQTLGSAADVSNAPFSAIALLSQSGQLPTVPVKKAVSNCMSKLMLDLLRRFKESPPDDFDSYGELKASEIPDDLTLKVLLEIKLPQDVFRNAQTAQGLVDKGLVTAEWARENMLQISDPDKMQDDVWEEQSATAFYRMLQEQFMRQAMSMAEGEGGAPGAAPGGPPAAGPTPTPVVPGRIAGGEEAMGGVMAPGGPMAAAAGGGRIEATEPIAPAGSRPPRGGMYGQR